MNLNKQRWVWRGVIEGVCVVIAVSCLTFLLLAAAGGDAIAGLNERGDLSQRQLAELRRVYDLDAPLVVRYGRWLGRAVQGDWGVSIHYQMPVAGLLVTRGVRTVMLGAVAWLLAVASSIALASAPYLLGGEAALIANRAVESHTVKRRVKLKTLMDKAAAGIVLINSTLPRLVLSLIVLAVAVRGKLFIDDFYGAKRFAVAACVLALPLTAWLTAQGSEGLSRVMGEDFVTAARARGLSNRRVVCAHAWRGVVTPFVTVCGLSAGALMSGSIIVESVFGLNGLGSLTVTALRARDVPLLLGVVTLTGAMVVMANAVAQVFIKANDVRYAK